MKEEAVEGLESSGEARQGEKRFETGARVKQALFRRDSVSEQELI